MHGYYIFCDESVKRGKYYSNFYGGLIIEQRDYEKVNNALISKLQDIGFGNSELKWENVNTYVFDAYKEIVNIFFQFIKEDTIKLRIMFNDNRFVPTNLTKEHYDHQYHILYYHFLKHAFGLRYLISPFPLHLEIFFDNLPDKSHKNEKFKKFIYGLQFIPEFSRSSIVISEESIYEVDSKKHILMQCLDIVLGSMAFRLNDMHLEIPKGSKRRGKRTVAKEKLYKLINSHIREIRPNFNIGITTGIDGDERNRLFHSYRHWLFTPKLNKYNE